MNKLILVSLLFSQSVFGQTSYMGKTIWDWQTSPCSVNNGREIFNHAINEWNGGWGAFGGLNYGIRRAPPPALPVWRVIVPYQRPFTLNSTNVVVFNRSGDTLNLTVNGSQLYSLTTNTVSQIDRIVLNAHELESEVLVDNFHINGVTNTFSNPNNSGWNFYNEVVPVGTPFWHNVGGTFSYPPVTQARWDAVAQAVWGGVTNGQMRLRAAVQNERIGGVYAEYIQTLSGDFNMGFSFVKTGNLGHFRIFLIHSGRPSFTVMPIVPTYVNTIRTRLNPRSGKVEVIKQGLLTHRGFLRHNGRGLNRRQLLRGYR